MMMRDPASRRGVLAGMVMLASLLCAPPVRAQETVRIELPSFVSFPVTDISRPTTGHPQPTTVSYSDAQLEGTQRLRISVKAEDGWFVQPSGTAIPASHISWTASAPVGGMGSPGTISATTYGLVFESNVDPTSGSVDLTWTLAAPPAGIRAGDHTLNLRWKVESISP